MKKHFLFLIGAVLLILHCKPDKRQDSPQIITNPVVIKNDSLFQTKSYSLNDSVGFITFEVYLSDLNKGIIRYRHKGAEPLNKQADSMKRILKTIFNDSTLNVEFSTLHWGRLNNSTNRDFTMAKRVALASANSDEWDKKSGKPFQGHANSFVQNLANSHKVYPELVNLFADFNYKIEVSGVEKVLVQQANKMPFWSEISDKVSSSDKLPFDCQTWFRIEKVKK